jgi:hypothetical protein
MKSHDQNKVRFFCYKEPRSDIFSNICFAVPLDSIETDEIPYHKQSKQQSLIVLLSSSKA